MNKFTHPNDAKPGHKWYTRDGREVEIYKPNAGGGRIIGAWFERSTGKWHPAIWRSNGGWILNEQRNIDLVDVPVKHTRWINVYNGNIYHTHPTRKEADEYGGTNRIACIKIEYEEGEGL